ncbi:MAG: hypothetical protein ABSF98_03975 [Bryobacteraceae bacterium]|jgi:hypothetical protein
MIGAFSTTTAFRLVRRLAMGQGSNGMYLLTYEDGARLAIETDLRAEVEVQMASPLPMGRVSEPHGVDDALGLPAAGPIRVLWIDHWSAELVAMLDTHVVRLERTGAQFLFLTTPALAEKLLVEAPNFRNRLTDVLRIVPDDPSGGDAH